VIPTVRVYWLFAETPVHIGAGRGSGTVDLPVARERVTQWPVIPGSSLRGVLRDHFEPPDAPAASWVRRAFGSRPSAGEEQAAGALAVSDGHLVMLPVPSLYGTFAWVTSPLALARLRRDLVAAGTRALPAAPDPAVGVGAVARLAEESVLADANRKMYLEDYDLATAVDPEASAWAAFITTEVSANDARWADIARTRFAIVPDNVFTALARRGTDVVARIRVDDEGRAAAKALWYEENVPSYTLFEGVVWCDPLLAPRPTEVLTPLGAESLHVQIGGHAGVGRGLVTWRLAAGEGEAP
jgi:CRISPR-associated protein Cmr4